jgi:hypothetical protein
MRELAFDCRAWKCVRIPGHVCFMLVLLYFPVACNPSRTVTLSNIGVPHYIRVPHRVTYP